jgi:hypothetical protein
MPLINWQAFAVVASGFARRNVYVAHANRERNCADASIHQAIENLNLHCGVSYGRSLRRPFVFWISRIFYCAETIRRR